MSGYDIHSLTEVLKASESKKTLGSSISSTTQLMFRSKQGNNLGPEDAKKIEQFIKFVEETYDTKLQLIGGGYEPEDSIDPKLNLNRP